MMAELEGEGVEINDKILNKNKVDDGGIGTPTMEDELFPEEIADAECNEGEGKAKKKWVFASAVLVAATLSSVLLAITFGTGKKDSSGELDISSVNSAAIALADCLEEERAAADQLLAVTKTEPTFMPTTYEPTALLETPVEAEASGDYQPFNSNDYSLDGSVRRNLRSKNNVAKKNDGAAKMRRLQCEEILAEVRSPTGEPTQTQPPQMELQQTKSQSYIPTTLPTKTPTEQTLEDHHDSVIAFWTPDRIQQAEPKHYTLIDINIRPAALSSGNETDKASFVDNDPWEFGGDVLTAAGRLVFRQGASNYRCSATAVTDGDENNGRSIILTAAHCVYDETTKAFHDNFLFIPNQDDQGSDITDVDCTNDPYGCWTPSFAVVDDEWANKLWPANIPSDYAFLVVNDVGSHKGPSSVNAALDNAVKALDINFQPPAVGSLAYALGYPANKDTATTPSDFRYCRRTLEEFPSRGGYLLDGCGLQGGASGGPWIQNIDDEGRGEIIAVNSYGPGGIAASFMSYMGGPRLHGNSAECLFEKAKAVPEEVAGNGIVVSYIAEDCASSAFVASTGQPTSAPSIGPTSSPTIGPTANITQSPTSTATVEPV